MATSTRAVTFPAGCVHPDDRKESTEGLPFVTSPPPAAVERIISEGGWQ
jgi:hypothetical protein